MSFFLSKWAGFIIRSQREDIKCAEHKDATITLLKDSHIQEENLLFSIK